MNVRPPGARPVDVGSADHPAAPAYVDSHAHLDDPAFDADRDAVVAAAQAAGVVAIVNVGYRPVRWETTVALAGRHPAIACALGLHPHHADEFAADTCDRLAAAIAQSGAVAVGEIGLDFYRDRPSAMAQQVAFEAQIELGRRLDRPIIIHQRAAETELTETLRRFPDLPPVVLHSFEGSDRLAGLARDCGFLIGVGGLATRAGAQGLREVLRTVPVGSLLLETDSPYLTPAAVKDRRNVPANIPIIAERLAPLWGLPADELAARTTETARRVFRLRSPAALAGQEAGR